MVLNEIAEEIRYELDKVREKLKLTFTEEDHKYTMLDENGILRENYPSVSSVIKKFYVPFNDVGKALEMSNGDVVEQKKLLSEWKKKGELATNMGSRVHYFLEKHVVNLNNDFKQIREPIFECDSEQIIKSDKMIGGGKKYIDLMLERGAVLLDTEIILGDNELGYTGQGDKAWLIMNKDGDDFGFIISDWKTNAPKNFEVQPYTKKLKHPFQNYHDTALSHYYLQLPLYGKLLLKMLEHTKFRDKKLLGCIVVHLLSDGTFNEYRVPNEIKETILKMDIKKYL